MSPRRSTSQRPTATEAPPSGPRDPRQLGRARALAHLLDRSFRIPGTSRRFGLDPILGLLPVGGDVIAALGSGYILYVAWRNGAPGAMIGRMLTNVVVDTLVGSVPVAGDLFDAWWKANARNVRMLDDWLGDEGPRRRHGWLLLAGILALLIVLLAGVVALFWMLATAIF